MPVIIKKTTLGNVKLGIWKLLEDEDFFTRKMPLSPLEKQELADIKGKKRLHWLASRYMLHLLTAQGERWECLKDVHGKPYLEHSNEHISFSHSDQLIAVAMSGDVIGIDIQRTVGKIKSIEHKFVNEEDEVIEPNLLGLHLIWGAKEAAFKAYGKKQVDFKNHLRFSLRGNEIKINMDKNGEKFIFKGKYEKWGEFILVLLKETHHV